MTAQTPTPPDLPEIRFGKLLGDSPTGRVWAGVLAPDRSVAVKVLAAQSESLDLSRFGAPSEHLVRLIRSGPCAGGTALVMERAEGGTLTGLIRERGRLDPGEVVTLIGGLAAGLDALHSAGVRHGDLAPGNVGFTRVGLPLLLDLDRCLNEQESGTPGFSDPIRAEAESDDLYGLGAVAWFALVGAAPEATEHRLPLDALAPGTPTALVALVGALLGPAQRRPGAAQLRRTIASFPVTATPIALVAQPAGSALHEPVHVTARQAHHRAAPPAVVPAVRHGRVRRLLIPVAVALVLATTAGVWVSRGQDRSAASAQPSQTVTPVTTSATAPASASTTVSTPTVSTAPSPATVNPTAATSSTGATGSSLAQPTGTVRLVIVDDPVQALTELNRQRLQALSTGDPASLMMVDVPGSPALAHDQALMTTMKQQRYTLTGFSVVLEQVAVVGHSADTTTLRVRWATPAFQQGTATQAATPSRVVLIDLVRDDAGAWRFSQIRST